MLEIEKICCYIVFLEFGNFYQDLAGVGWRLAVAFACVPLLSCAGHSSFASNHVHISWDRVTSCKDD